MLLSNPKYNCLTSIHNAVAEKMRDPYLCKKIKYNFSSSKNR